MAAIQAALPKSRQWKFMAALAVAVAVTAVAVAVTAADIAVSGWESAVSTLSVSLVFGLGFFFVSAFLSRFLRLYSDAASGSVIPPSELRADMTVDWNFFRSRFPCDSDFPEKTFGKMRQKDVEILRSRIEEARRSNPSVPDEIRILKHRALSPYLLIGTATTSFWHLFPF